MYLSPTQARVLGALIEKEIVTPENYPLSLNALVNACNQKSSREPVMELSERDVRDALYTLDALELTRNVPGDRVPKYEHRIRDILQLRRDETALICLLLLRGPQTPGELRTRAERMYNFDDLDAVLATLNRLATRTITEGATEASETTGPLTAVLPRQPGARESRYTHLLSGPPDLTQLAVATPTTSANPRNTQISEACESRFQDLQSQIEALQSRLTALETKLQDL